MKIKKNKVEYWQTIIEEPCCMICGRFNDLHRHHIFYGTNRKNSEKYGMIAILCSYHHNMSDQGIHFNKQLDATYKRNAEKWFLSKGGTVEEFISIFGRNWI